jgi:hypothetical protein
MKRLALGGFALLVTAAVALLVLSSRSDSTALGAPPPAPEQPRPAADHAGDDRPAGAGAERPRLADEPAAADTPALPALTEPREYVRDDGIVVRDHRAGDQEPDLTKQIARPRKAQRIEPELLVTIKNAVRPHVTACTDRLPADAFGADPRVQGEVIVAIEDDQVSITKLNLQLDDVRDDGLTDCVRQAVSAVTVPAGGHAPLDAYTLTLPFRVRR